MLKKWFCHLPCCESIRDDCLCNNKGIILLLAWSAVIHCFGYYPILFLATIRAIDDDNSANYPGIPLIVFTGIIYPFYPLIGLLTEIYWTRYKAMVAGTVVAIIGGIIATPSFIALVLLLMVESTSTYSATPLTVLGCIGVAVYQLGLALFRANVIQFGTDQLQFSNSQKLSSFVYLYFWSIPIFRLPSYIILFSYIWVHKFKSTLPIMIFDVCIQGLFMILVVFLLIFCCCHWNKCLIKDPTTYGNPAKLICKILLFVKNNKQPCHRSAFTYTEMPSRMDIAKKRYGGPFTTDQVEDVKTFGRIVLLLATLFGALQRPIRERSTIDQQSALEGFYREFPSIHFLELLIIIPVYLLVIKPLMANYLYKISLLHKVQVGLILGVASNLLIIPAEMDPGNRYISLIYAILSAITFPISYFLVFLSILEFLLAQGPYDMQGLLIGLWYTNKSLHWILYLFTQYTPFEENFISILKTCLSFVSLILFVIVSRRYKYRQRNEISDINRQHIIEEYTARTLDMQPVTSSYEYTQEQSEN